MFPRPDDPLASAHQKAINARGGNGFLTVAATRAALLLAQAPVGCCARCRTRAWSRFWIRASLPARYRGFLRASLQPFWTTYEP
jgi:ATP-dependent DNA helicase DinG